MLGVLTGPEVHRLQLAPLSTTGVAALAGEGVDPVEVHAVTKGNPFFVTEVLSSPGAASAAHRPRCGARSCRPVDPGDPGAAAERSPWCRPMPSAGWPRLSGPDASMALTEAERSGVLAGDLTHVWFRHELARTRHRGCPDVGGTASIEPARRGAARRSVATSELNRLVHHAARANDVERVLRYGPPAALDAIRLGSHRQAIDLIRLVLAHADRLPDRRGRPVVGPARLLAVCREPVRGVLPSRDPSRRSRRAGVGPTRAGGRTGLAGPVELLGTRPGHGSGRGRTRPRAHRAGGR